jgi:prepilin-type N-terminal cleavage/methylation domain-containing protein
MNKYSQKGFTLLELLIVIGVLAVLATATVLVLNPIEILRQSRDATRVSDLASIKNAIGVYVTGVDSPDLDGGTTSCSTLCYVNAASVTANCGGRHSTKTTTEDSTREVDASGWIPIDFTDIPGGSPLSVLPVDPTNDATYFYSYACDNTNKTFELDVVFESTKYLTTEDYDGNDGGNTATVYEIGTDPGLDI